MAKGVGVKEPLYVLTRLCKGQAEIIYRLGRNEKEIWFTVIDEELMGTGYTREQLHKDGWRAHRCSITVWS